MKSITLIAGISSILMLALNVAALVWNIQFFIESPQRSSWNFVEFTGILNFCWSIIPVLFFLSLAVFFFMLYSKQLKK